MNKVSVIIAAKNEGPRIGSVLDVVTKHPLVDEVIAMCNGCTDNTVDVARSYGVNVHEDARSIGKTKAIKKGISLAKNDVVLLIDADLRDLVATDITNLASPVLTGQVDFTLSTRENSLLLFKLFGIDFISGERGMRKDLLDDPYIWSKSHVSYGLEVLMNKSLLKRGKTFISVMTKSHAIRKREKTSLVKGTLEDYSMIFNIFRVIPFYEFFWQLFKMSYLSKRYKKMIKAQTKASSASYPS
ncbi:MAG: glycosyltransferase [bacterium]|nr:glycosyltransferase [bacterium]